MRVLVVEDERDLNNIITKYLKKNNFNVDNVFDGEEALDYLNSTEYDLVILDVMMPKINGYEVLKTMRKENNDTPVLMLTAKDGIDDKVKGLDLGADDYLIKPFDFDELSARIRAITRRKFGNTTNILQIDDLMIDINKKIVTRAGINIELTAKEYDCSYGQVYTWVKKYEERGVEGLYDRRGRSKPMEELTETERLQAENRLLKAQTKQQQMEINFLKKLNAVERR